MWSGMGMGIFRTELIWLVFYGVFFGVQSLKDVEVSVPSAIRIGGTVTLQCRYDLEGEPLYTVKWYKGTKEFYRFIPKELPSTRVFPLTGLDVDLSKSTPNEVVLRNVQPEVTGRYKCEVLSDAPNFDTKMDVGYMYVVDIPTDDPVLYIEKDFLDIGDVIKGNCSGPPSYPSTNVSWYLNGKRIPASYIRKTEVLEHYPAQRKRVVTTSELHLQITDNTFQAGKAVLSCVATLFNIYRGEKKEILEDTKPKPHPSSVLGPRDESSGSQGLESIFIYVAMAISLFIEAHR